MDNYLTYMWSDDPCTEVYYCPNVGHRRIVEEGYLSSDLSAPFGATLSDMVDIPVDYGRMCSEVQ